LADALEELLGDPERARALGATGRRAVLADFGAERMARDFEAVLRRRLPAARSPRPIAATR
jgi:glycosyltransferase involved in cell wall biosynthesis